MTGACAFCRLYRNRCNVHYDDPESGFWGMFDLHPVSPGHFLLMPNFHVESLSDLGHRAGSSLFGTTQRVVSFIRHIDLIRVYERMIERALTERSPWFARRALAHPRFGTVPDAYNFVINDGPEAGRTVDHFHLHIIPRFAGDVADPRGGGRYVIPEMGNYHLPRGE